MPNHVRNKIYFGCDEKRLKEVLNAIKYEDDGVNRQNGIGTLDFRKIIPMPESLNIESGSSTDRGIELYLTSVNPDVTYFGGEKMPRDQFRLLTARINEEKLFGGYRSRLTKDEIDKATQYSDKDKLLALGKTAVENFMNYGAVSWYEFCCREWGTKWNSYDPDTYIAGHNIRFSTAWSAPHPVLRKLSEMFPDVTVTHQWADEDISRNCGEMTYVGGECTEECCPDEGSVEAYDLAFSVWNDTAENFGYCLSADGSEYIYTEGEEFELVELAGKGVLFTAERLDRSRIPQGLYLYHLRMADGQDIGSLEAEVTVNHAGCIISDEPIDLGIAQVFRQKNEVQQTLDNYLAIYSITVYNSIKQGEGYTDTIQAETFTDDAVTALGFDEDDNEKVYTNKDRVLVCTMSRPSITVTETDGIGLTANYELTLPVYFGGSKVGEVTIPVKVTSTFTRK